MTTIAHPPPAPPLQPPFPVARFTLDQYHRMIHSGVFDEDERVELLKGWVTPKMPRNPPHDSTVTRVHRALRERLGDEWVVRPQCAATLTDSEPEPDVAVAVGPDGRYDDHHPGPAEIVLVVEVADTSVDRDRDAKGPMYAEVGIPRYWIVNIPDRRVEVYTDPTGPADAPAYRRRQDYGADEWVPVTGFNQAVAPILVRDLLPALPPAAPQPPQP